MRYYTILNELPGFEQESWYGIVWLAGNHPVYNVCTLYKIGEKGLAVIQQRYNEINKTTCWGVVDPPLVDQIYLHPRFKEYFDAHAGKADKDGFFPTVTIRQIMWGLRMKPLKKERWETTFDRCPI